MCLEELQAFADLVGVGHNNLNQEQLLRRLFFEGQEKEDE